MCRCTNLTRPEGSQGQAQGSRQPYSTPVRTSGSGNDASLPPLVHHVLRREPSAIQTEQLNYFWIVEKKNLEDKRAELRNKERELQDIEEKHQVREGRMNVKASAAGDNLKTGRQ